MALNTYYTSLPCNCSPKLYNPGQERCPKCNQWHLRPGYCQAVSNETFRETETGGETPWEAAGMSKATWYRKKRAGAPST
jgi:hypothetical protein